MRANKAGPLGVVGLLAILGVTSSVFAQDDQDLLEDGHVLQNGSSRSGAGSEGADFLLLTTGARSFAMGGAVTALKGSGESVLWNPAGVASLDKRRLLFTHSQSAFDTRSDVVGFIWPTKNFGNVGITYFLVDFGEFENTDGEGRVQGNINFRNQEFLLTYSTKIIGGIEGGVNYKLIQIVFRCDGTCPEQRSFTRTTHAFDIGFLASDVAGLPLRLGGSVRHLGFALKGDTESDELPTRVRVGLSYEALRALGPEAPIALALAVDLEDRVRDLGAPDLMVGSELNYQDFFFLRAGYSFLETGAGGPALGLGVEHEWFYLDLSRGFDAVSSATGEESVQVTFGVIF